MDVVYKEFVKMCKTISLEELQEIVKKYPDIESSLHEGLAFSWAAFGGNLDVVKYLFQECPENIQKKGARALCFATGGGDLGVVKYLVETCKMDVNVDSGLPLCNASGGGHLDIVKYLIEECGMPICDEHLLYAAQKPRKDVVKYLLNKGVSFSNFRSVEPQKSVEYCLEAKEFCQITVKEIKQEIKQKRMEEAEKSFQHNLKTLKGVITIKRPIRRRPKKNFKNGKL